MDIQPTTPTSPPPPPQPLSLREHIAAESAPAATEPEVASPAAPVAGPDEPALEADSTKPDADLSEAARTLRRNRADERKAKIQREIDEITRVKYEEQAQLEAIRRERAALAAEKAAPVAAPATDDPQPQESDYDDYGRFVADQARWAARQELKARQIDEQRTRQQLAHDQTVTAHAQKLEAQHQAGREKYSDFDVVLDPVIQQIQRNPRAEGVARFFASSEVGGEIAYKLGKDATALKAVLSARDPFALASELARVEASVLASKAAPKPITAAPAPPSQTVGGSASASSSSRPVTSLREHIEREEAEIAERRKSGYR